MYRNPAFSHQAEAPPPQPPVEDGVNLATIPRGPGEQLRVTLSEFNGHRYLAVRVWALGQDGRSWWPVKGKGVSIRLREILAVGQALARAFRSSGNATSGQRCPVPSDRRNVHRHHRGASGSRWPIPSYPRRLTDGTSTSVPAERIDR